MTVLADRTVVITGGTGSFGQAFVRHLFTAEARPRLVTVFSRGEHAQHEMSLDFPASEYPIRYCLGDVRDFERVLEVTEGADVVVHSAAMKHVPATENNPMECIKTNILGSQNVATAALRNGVPRVVALSTDKAALPRSLYGASKLCLEKLFLTADLKDRTRFTIARYANIFGSKGSVVPVFLRRRKDGVLPITDPAMTRFSMTMEDAIDLVLFAVREGWGGEVIVPIAPSYRLLDVARAIAPDAKHRILGIRPAENMHEWLIGSADAPHTVRRKDYYVICPVSGRYDAERYARDTGAQRVPPGFTYVSDENDVWLSVEDIRSLVAKEVTGD